jgi:hypothetical protein
MYLTPFDYGEMLLAAHQDGIDFWGRETVDADPPPAGDAPEAIEWENHPRSGWERFQQARRAAFPRRPVSRETP